MLELVNQTPYAVALVPFTDRAGIDHLAVVVKATWDLAAAASGREPALAPEQRPVLFADERSGDDPQASLRYEADAGPPRPGTDVALVGHAYPERPGQATAEVSLAVGPVRRTVRVFGDRVWYRGATGWRWTDPRPFERMPLVWERAFGGVDASDPDPARHARDERNPAGTGFAARNDARRLDGLRLPNLEDPAEPIESWSSRPAPAAFAPIHRFWEPRRRLAGTYDGTWQETRAPLLPEDFDDRHLNSAPPGLVVTPGLQGGEAVVARGVQPAGALSFTLPRRRPSVVAVVRQQRRDAVPRLDALWIDGDTRQLVTVWRAALRCPRELLHVRAVFVKEAP